jgi:hypothetical protein
MQSTKIYLGSSLSSAKVLSVHNSDPATYLAGLAVRQSATADVLSLTSGVKIGISMGRSLSDHKKTSVLRSGESVPVRMSLKRSTGTVTITSYANLVSGTDDSITVGATVFTAQTGAATLGDATFRAATSNDATATSLAAQINAHAVASTKVYAVAAAAIVTLYSVVEGAGTGHDVALAYTDNDTNIGATVSGAALSGGSDTIGDIAYAAIGAKVYFNDVTGKADIAMTGFSTISDAVYVSIEKDAIDEADATVAGCLIDMPGGL